MPNKLTPFQKSFKAGKPIECIRNDAKLGNMEIRLDCHELTWNCGLQHQPDFGRVIITYVPDKLVAETRATKFYLTAFRYHDAYNEELAIRILSDFLFYVKPHQVKVELIQTSRGGIQNTVTVQWDSSNDADVRNWEKLKYIPRTSFRGGWPLVK